MMEKKKAISALHDHLYETAARGCTAFFPFSLDAAIVSIGIYVSFGAENTPDLLQLVVFNTLAFSCMPATPMMIILTKTNIAVDKGPSTVFFMGQVFLARRAVYAASAADHDAA